MSLPLRRRSSRLLASLALAVCACGGLMRGDEPLSGPSPFLPPASAGGNAAAPTADTPIELRGIMQSPAGTMFSIFDPSRHTSTWVKLNESGRDFIVRRYDERNDSVAVDYQGRSVTLALHTAKVGSAPVENPPANVNGPTPPPIGGPVVLNPSPADEQRRLEAIAAEVNRRRQLRQQALRMQQQQQRPPQPK